MIDLDKVSANPLAWPASWPRVTRRMRARFAGHSMERGIRQVYRELRLMEVPDWNVIISSNVELRLDGLPRSNRRPPSDPGVAVYFRLDGEPHVLACDKWDKPEHNLWAIAKHIEALRAQDRWGVGTLKQAFTGYKALPAPGDDGPWWAVLGFEHEPETLEQAHAQYRRLSIKAHPDSGGTEAEFKALNEAYAAAQRAFKHG